MATVPFDPFNENLWYNHDKQEWEERPPRVIRSYLSNQTNPIPIDFNAEQGSLADFKQFSKYLHEQLRSTFGSSLDTAINEAIAKSILDLAGEPKQNTPPEETKRRRIQFEEDVPHDD